MQTQSTLPARQFPTIFIVSDAFNKTTSAARFSRYQSNLLRVRAAVVGPLADMASALQNAGMSGENRTMS